ncbi:MAG: peptidase [Gemmatimonadetes bacterium]|nr:peptidase [Gemmatimonadota bacterium]
MHRLSPWAGGLLALVVCTAACGAQTPAPTTIDAATRREVVDSLATRLVRMYVDADTGRMIADKLRARLAAGAYDSASDPRRFSDLLTSDLQSVNGDKHLSASYAPGAAGSGGPRPVPPGGAPQNDVARRDHWGLGRVDVLPGNVGYMKVNGFDGSPAAIAATAGALKYLEGTDAMIFDFRGMGGGSGQQSNYLISHFVSADTVPSLLVVDRFRGTRRVRYTLASVPGLRRTDVPIWILIDRGTASAGEDFSFVLQQLGRAKTVGDRTAGAGHNNGIFPIAAGFSASISLTRVSDARTGKEWERVGVQPDIRVNPGDALIVAHLAALDSLQRSVADPAQRAAVATARVSVEAQAHPHAVAGKALVSYTGTYEGGRVIALEGGTLVYRRDASRPPRALVAVNDSTFVLNNAIQVTFERDASGTMRMVQRLADGSLFVIPRLGDVPGELAP